MASLVEQGCSTGLLVDSFDQPCSQLGLVLYSAFRLVVSPGPSHGDRGLLEDVFLHTLPHTSGQEDVGIWILLGIVDSRTQSRSTRYTTLPMAWRLARAVGSLATQYLFAPSPWTRLIPGCFSTDDGNNENGSPDDFVVTVDAADDVPPTRVVATAAASRELSHARLLRSYLLRKNSSHSVFEALSLGRCESAAPSQRWRFPLCCMRDSSSGPIKNCGPWGC